MISSQVLSNPHLKYVASLFNDEGFVIRLAGGVVRDILLDQKPNDIDLATEATPDQMKKILQDKPTIRMFTTPAGERHGTVSALVDGETLFEITTLRIDRETDGRHAEVEFIKDWQLDALRRDFTINSMFMELDGKVIDYFDGQNDLKEGIVRFVGNPVDRIKEDYLRILRYFRFYCRFGTKDHLEETLKAIRENLDGLKSISGERIWVEVKKTLAHKRANKVIPLMMADLKMGRYMGFPEKPELSMEEFLKVYDNVWSMNTDFDPATIFSSLIRNDEELMSIILCLKLSNLEKAIIGYILEQRNEGDHISLRKLQKQLITTSKSMQDSQRKLMLEFLKYRGSSDIFKEFESWPIPQFPLTGNKLKNRVKKAWLIGKIMNELRLMWVDSDFELSEDELMEEFDKLVEKYSDDNSPSRTGGDTDKDSIKSKT